MVLSVVLASLIAGYLYLNFCESSCILLVFFILTHFHKSNQIFLQGIYFLVFRISTNENNQRQTCTWNGI